MREIVCPKCQFRQQEGPECLRCGLIFERYREAGDASPGPPAPAAKPTVRGMVASSKKASPWRKAFRIARWVSLTGAVLALVLIFLDSPAPVVKTDPDAGRRVEEKLRETRAALESGQPHALRLDEAEVNTWLGQSLQTAASPDNPDLEAMIGREATVEEVRHVAENLKMKLEGDEVMAYLTFDFHGTELSLSVRGTLRAVDGYLRLEATSGRLGSLPIPQAALRRAVDRVFSAPENQEKLRLPDNVQDIRIQNGEVVITYR